MPVLALSFRLKTILFLALVVPFAATSFAQPKVVPKTEQSCAQVSGASNQYIDAINQSLGTHAQKIELVKTTRSERYGCGYIVKTPSGTFFCQISTIQNMGEKYFAHTSYDTVYCERN